MDEALAVERLGSERAAAPHAIRPSGGGGGAARGAARRGDRADAEENLSPLTEALGLITLLLTHNDDTVDKYAFGGE